MRNVQLAVKLGDLTSRHVAPKNGGAGVNTLLGCKWSLVQIQSRRPIYLSVITNNLSLKVPRSGAFNSAHVCSKLHTNEWVAGGKIGVQPEGPFGAHSKSRGRPVRNLIQSLSEKIRTSQRHLDCVGGRTTMARIRSIKPEFWTDGTNLRLSDACALFFIGLWNFCDDEGKHRLDLNQLVAELGGRWRRDKVSLFIDRLRKSGQIRISSDSEWLQITGWSHQKIDRPKPPDVKAADLQWLSVPDSSNDRDDSRGIDARIGSDRRDRIGSDRGAKPKRSRALAPAAEEQIGRELVKTYCEVWAEKYKTNPTIMGKDAKNLKRFGEEVGLDRGRALITAYLKVNDAWFRTKRHDIQTFLQNIAIVTQFADTGAVVTQTQIRAGDVTQTNLETIKAIRSGALHDKG